MTRRRSLAYIGAALLVPGCAAAPARGTVRIGSTNADQNQTIAEVYALMLERANVPVARRMRLGDSADVMAAMQRGDIDLFPGDVRAGNTIDGRSKAWYGERYGVTWLSPAPANVGSCVTTSQYAAEQYSLLTLETCARLAPQLRLSATREFVAHGGPLDELRAAYGGFRFKAISVCEPGTQYYALNRGDADVANGVTTDPSIGEDQLVVLGDSKRVFPEYHPAPVIRVAALAEHTTLARVLERASGMLTAYALQAMNARRDALSWDPRDVAEDFLERHRRFAALR